MTSEARPPSLDELGILHGTDKSSRKHNYLFFYEKFLADRRHDAIRLMEIGVFKGASLRMWRDYFPNGNIIGIDNDPDAAIHAGDRIEVHHGDQAVPEGLAVLAQRLGPLDMIVDDGSHIWSDQIGTMRSLLPLVKSGGIYILEDLHTSFGSYVERYGFGADESAARFCWNFAERVLADRSLKLDPEPDQFLADAPKLVKSVHFSHRTAVFLRK